MTVREDLAALIDPHMHCEPEPEDAYAAADAILAKYRLTPIEDAKAFGGDIYPYNSVWLYPSTTIQEVNIGIQTIKLAEPFKVPETGWYRFNAETRTMERA